MALSRRRQRSGLHSAYLNAIADGHAYAQRDAVAHQYCYRYAYSDTNAHRQSDRYGHGDAPECYSEPYVISVAFSHGNLYPHRHACDDATLSASAADLIRITRAGGELCTKVLADGGVRPHSCFAKFCVT